jgi:predicted Rossmann fold flavoprotein
MKIDKNNNIAIIGAGASGLIIAILAKQFNQSLNITIYEKNDKIGKKILASGNGRCNITNIDANYKNYHGENPNFVKYALEQFNFKKSKEFFESIGLILDIKDDGKVYPLSNEAKSVVKILEQKANQLGINFVFNYTVNNIEQKNTKFIINDINKKYDKLIISTGLAAALQLGATQDGIKFAKSFDHNIIDTYPALVGLQIDSNIPSKLFGVKIYSEVTLYINNKQEQSVLGDVLFTKYGVSGFAILDISTKASYALRNNQDVQISINLLPKYKRTKLLNILSTFEKNNKTQSIEDILVGILPQKLIRVVAKNSIKQTVNEIQNMRFCISNTHGFKHAEASGGGVDTSEIDEKTMQSKKISGLYFSGEVLDIVGNRGGYNFAFAFASGYLVAKHISEEK